MKKMKTNKKKVIKRRVKKLLSKRKAPRQIHIIDDQSSHREIESAKNDFRDFFLDVLDKHHGF